jgi:hypothetical protein
MASKKCLIFDKNLALYDEITAKSSFSWIFGENLGLHEAGSLSMSIFSSIEVRKKDADDDVKGSLNTMQEK